jgi:hypothetical protein
MKALVSKASKWTETIERYIAEGRPVSGGDGTFSQITVGPPAASGVNTNKQSLILDRQNGIVETVPDSGTTQAHRSILPGGIIPAQTALTTITTTQTLLTLALNAGVLNKLKRTVKVMGEVIYTSAGTTQPVLTLLLKLGSVSLCSIALPAMSATARTAAPLKFEYIFEVAATGSSGTIESHGKVDADLNAAAGSAVSSILDANTAVSSAVDLTSALTLAVTIVSTLTLTSMQLRAGRVEVIN